MKLYLIGFLSLGVLLIGGCSKPKTPQIIDKPKPEVTTPQVLEKPKIIVKPKVEIKNIDAINHNVNLFLNKKYALDMKEELHQNIHYDLEYVNTLTKTYIFVLFRYSFMFCGSGGCSGLMLEYKDGNILEIESLTLIKSSIYLIHNLSENGFSKIVIPVSFINGDQWGTYYNIYNPFTEEEHSSLYPKESGYKELKRLLDSRKTSIKLFENEE